MLPVRRHPRTVQEDSRIEALGRRPFLSKSAGRYRGAGKVPRFDRAKERYVSSHRPPQLYCQNFPNVTMVLQR